MAPQRGSNSTTTYLQAVIAAILTVFFGLAFLAIDKEAGEGWFQTFLLAALPSAAVVSGAYAAVYFVLIRRGLSHDDQLAQQVAERVVSSLDSVPSVEAVLMDTTEPDWSRFLAESDRLVVAARSLARWTSNVDADLKVFLARGAELEVFSHDPANTDNLAIAAPSHAGYADFDAERVRTNAASGLRRLVRARPAAGLTPLQIWFVETREFVFTLSLFAFFRGGRLVRVVLRPQENVRAGVTSAPLIVLRPDPDGALDDFVAREIEGLQRVSRELKSDEIDGLA